MNDIARHANPLLALHDHGQSYWIDNLTRRMVLSGELKRRAMEEGLRGVTSNPSIFHKAISGSSDYDDQILAAFSEGKGVAEVYEELVTTDVREACDALRAVYEETKGADGFVSLEVSPYLARDTNASIDEARRLHRTVGRSNLMIKIPGTREGAPAVEELLYEGIDVNVTLLFSVEAYERVAEAYLRALERRLAAGRPIDRTSSVASFFLSRIDVMVDKLLEQRMKDESDPGLRRRIGELLGKAGVANAKLAYASFERLLNGQRWRALAAQGAKPQRMLWASTSTKNPAYSDVMYVEPLIGPFTVNTMPDETIAAFADHGKVGDTVDSSLEEARRVMESLASLGIDFGGVTDRLEDEGIQKFIDPYDSLLKLIEAKRPK